MFIQMSPFKELYGYDPTTFGSLITLESQVPRAHEFIQQNIDILKALKDNLQVAQNKKAMYNKENL
jgi:hypothetical protein